MYDSGDSPYDTSGCPDAETQDTDDDAERPCAPASPPGPSALSGHGLGTHRVAGSSIPRDCRACGETFPSGNALFRHLNDAHVCPCAPGSPPGSSDPSADDSPTSDSGGPEQRFDDSPAADDAAPRDTRPDHGTPSGGSGGARADAGGRRDGAASANGSDAVMPEANAPGPGPNALGDAPAVSSVSVPEPGLAGRIADCLARLLAAGDEPPPDPALPSLLAAALSHILGSGSAGAPDPCTPPWPAALPAAPVPPPPSPSPSAPATSRAHPPAVPAAHALGAGADGAPVSSAPPTDTSPSTAPAPPPPPEDPPGPPALSRKAIRAAARAQARAAGRAAQAEARATAAADAARSRAERTARARSNAQVNRRAREAAQALVAAEAAAERQALDAAIEQARIESRTLRELSEIRRTAADPPPPLCASPGCSQACDPTGERAALCAQKGYPGPITITRCFSCSLRRNLYFKRQRQGSSPPNAAGTAAIPESTDAAQAGVAAGARRAATDAHAGETSDAATSQPPAHAAGRQATPPLRNPPSGILLSRSACTSHMRSRATSGDSSCPQYGDETRHTPGSTSGSPVATSPGPQC